MNANAAAKYYERLTPEERFRLMLAAGARGDEAERARLIDSGERIFLSVSDYAPYAEAFYELALVVFIDLLEDAARYLDAFHRTDDADFIEGADTQNGPEEDKEMEADPVPGKKSAWMRCLDMALAAGFVLRAKADGWKLFCERLTVPPFALWEGLSGLDRLQRALALAEGHDDLPGAAFTAEGMLRWLNGIRPPGAPALTEVKLTAEAIADETEELFRAGVARRRPS
jgi:hypothetical protein